MRLSLTHARSKQLLKTDSKLWLMFTATVTLLILFIEGMFTIQIYSFESRTESYKEQTQTVREQIQKAQEAIAFVKLEGQLGQEVQGKNMVLKESIRNLFDLIPDQIYLTEAKIEANLMELKGYTPSKEVFEFLLLPQLKSIFSKTSTLFFPLPNGGFRFVSINYSEEDVIYETH